ncbi:MAG: hypothetical protein ACRCTZ_21425 [Sarcina sp.]
MKLIEKCKHPLKVRSSIPMKDHTCKQAYYYYRELIKNIKSNKRLKDLDLEQVTSICPKAIENGLIEYIIEIDDVEKESVFLTFKGEDYFLDAVPEGFSLIFGKEIINSEFFETQFYFYFGEDY